MAKGKWKSTLLGIQGIIGHRTAPDWDFLYEASATKDSNYNVGDRVVTPDGRVFRYAKCGVALTSQKYTCAAGNILVAENNANYVVATGGAAIGDKSVTLTVGATTIYGPGDAYGSPTGILAEDELRGGYISLYRGQDRQQRGIIGNTALGASGVSLTIHLDASLKTAMNAADRCEILASPYSYVVQSNGGWGAVVGVPTTIVSVGQYFWVQTWGICRITPTAAALGNTVDEREFYSKVNGVISLYTRIITETTSAQHIGFLVEYTNAVSGNAAPFINLQINP